MERSEERGGPRDTEKGGLAGGSGGVLSAPATSRELFILKDDSEDIVTVR